MEQPIYTVAQLKLKDFYMSKLSPESRAKRFGTYACDIDNYVNRCVQGNLMNSNISRHIILPNVNGDIIAHVHISIIDPYSFETTVAEIGIAVADEYVGQGIGTALMRSAIEVAKATRPGITRIVLLYGSDNAAAYKLIKKLGFRTTVEAEQSNAMMELDTSFGGEVSRVMFGGSRALLAFAEYLRAVYISTEFDGIELILGGNNESESD